MYKQNLYRPFPNITKQTVEPLKDGEQFHETEFMMHSHQFNEIAIVVMGNSNIFSYDYSRSISAPFAVIYPAGIPHMQVNHFNDGYERYLIRCENNAFEDPFMDKDAAQTLNSLKKTTCIELDEVEKRKLVSMCESAICLNDSGGYPMNMTALAIFCVLSEAWKRNHELLTADKCEHSSVAYLGELVDYLFEHCSEKQLLEEIASKFYISKTKLSRDFRSVFRMSVNEYIAEIRINKAKDMLLSGKSISETAEKCGFNTASYFVKCFKKSTGKTPMRFVQNPAGFFDKNGNRLFGSFRKRFAPDNGAISAAISNNNPKILFKGD